MALEIFKLVGSIFIDNDKANDSLQKTDKKATSLASTMGNAGKVAAGAAVAIGTAVVGAGTAIVGMANDTAKMADEIDKASIRMGVGAEEYQKLAYAAGQCGVETATLEAAAKKLEGTDINFDDAINQIMSLGTAEERSAAAAEMFGDKVAYTLSPLLEQSGEDFEGLKQRATDLGIVMSEEAVKSGVAYGDMQADLEKSFDSLKTTIGSAVMPVMNKLAEKLVQFMPTIQKLADRIGPLAADFIEKFLPPIFDLAEQLLPEVFSAVEELLPALSEIANEIIPIAVDLLKQLLPVAISIISEVLPVAVEIIQMLTPIIKELMEFLGPILQLVLSLVSPLLQLVMQILTPILNLVTSLLGPLLGLLSDVLTPIFGIISALLTPLTSLLGAILEPICKVLEILLQPLTSLLDMILPPLLSLVESFFSWASPYLTVFFEFLGQAVEDMIDWFSEGGLTGVFKKFGDFFKGLWEGITSVFKTAVNFIIKGINTLIEGLNKIKPPQWLTDLTGVTGVNLNPIPLLAEGGDIQAAGKAIVGEEGPELLDLPRGARVTPLRSTEGAGTGFFDYDKLANSLVLALQNSGFGNITIPVMLGDGTVENVVVNALNRANYRSGGR